MPSIAHFISPFQTPQLHTKISHVERSTSSGELVKAQVHDITKTTSSFRDKVKHVVEKVKQVAIVILSVALSTFLYWVNPSLFAIGFIAGIILDDQVRCAIQKIKDVWKSQKLAGTLFGGLACTLSMPVTIATASLLWSAHLGSLMSAEAQRILKGRPSADEMIQMHSAV